MNAPKSKRRWFYYSLGTLLAFIALCAILFLVAGFLSPLSLGYNVKATFSEMPDDDHQLKEWLKVQPSVVSNTVTICREGHTVFVGFITEGSAFGRPPFPDLPKACESLGYKGVVSEWADYRPVAAK